MNKLLIVETKKTTPANEEKYRKRVAKYNLLGNGEVEFDLVYHEDLLIKIKTNNVDIQFVEKTPINFTHVFIKGLKLYTEEAASLAQIFVSKGIIPIENSYETYSIGSKIYPLVISAINGVEIPQSIIFTKDHFGKYGTKYLLKDITYPFILKGVYGSLGINVYKVNNEVELEKYISKDPNYSFLIQQIIDSNYTLRVVTLGSKVNSAEERYVENREDGTFTNTGGNTSTKEVPVKLHDLSKKVSEDSELLSNKLNRNICGFDFLIENSTGKHFLIEANSYPGFNPDTDQGENFVKYISSL